MIKNINCHCNDYLKLIHQTLITTMTVLPTHEQEAWRLEHMPTAPQIQGSRRTSNQGLDARSLSTQQQMGPAGNTGGIKAARKGTGHPTSQSRWPRASVLSIRHSPTYGSYVGFIFTFTFTTSNY